MFVQILIYVYLGICAGMILFNIVTALLSQRREHRSFRDGIRLELTVSQELDRLAETGTVSERHLRFMERRLRRVNGMAAFDAALECLCVRRPELTRSYLTALNGVMITLAEDYCRRDEIEAAYFPYIIRKYRLLDGQENEALKTMLLDLLHESSIYCRENAMQALYTAGDPAVLVRALRIIDASSLYYHSKLLSDGLLNYTGDTWELADALWEEFDAFQPWMQVTLLNYFRFSSGAYCEKIHALLNDPAQDDEVRFACLRYLGRYPYPPAYADLLRYATPSKNARWEYAAIASSVLASYPGAETAAVLERNLYHPNWYIRFNASKSLEQLGFGYRDLIDVIEGHDRYSKNTTQAQQTANRQADIISAYPSGTVDSGAMRRQVLLCTIEHDGAERAIYVGFTNALTPELAGALAQALEDLSGAESIGVLADYMNSSGAEAYRTRWLITLAALIAAMLAAAVALIVFARKKRAEQKANALIDPRYGIGNDGYYLNCMETLIPAPLRSIVYVFCIGCDMPSLERRFGEAEREEIFSRAAEYLRLDCGREEYLACVGRGMFALVCQCGSREAAQQRAEGLIRGLDGYLAGFRAEYAGAFRAGICSLSENPDCGAEAALYNARQGCAHAFRTETPCAFSTRGMIDESEQLERLRGSMSKAVEKGEFEPYLQFVVDRAGTVVGAEAVSRWQNPEEGLLKPSKYIDLMIRAGTITELDLYMLRCACVQLQTWKREGRGTLWLSCNFTRQSIADEKILARVREIIEQYDFTRDRLVVELTEDSYARDREAALRTIEGLHAMGLRIVLDDIGAGYSSLSDLSTYPIDGVKIDRSIVIESALPRAHALLEGMIRLSHDMGIRVLCEGVENKATCDAVLAAGCDFIQGFYFSRVLPGREAESFLRSLAARDREEG